MDGSMGSLEPEGPGWWQAQDGRFYPPHLHPNYAALQADVARTEAAVEQEPPSRWRTLVATVAGTALVLVVLVALVLRRLDGSEPIDSSTLVRALFFGLVNLGATAYCGYVGREKGYSVIAFGLLGLFCSCGGVVVAHLIPPRRGYA